MNKLANALSSMIREKVRASTEGRVGTQLESRFIFHGPPLDLLEDVFEALSVDGGIHLSTDGSGSHVVLPVLLQLPSAYATGPNPPIGASGKCDESHLLHIRNDPHCPSFVALVPPGQHNNQSVSSTTDEFGMNASTNTGYATFEQWWDDGFTQDLLNRGIRAAGIEEEFIDDAKQIVERAAASIDQVDIEVGSRKAVWRLLSRIFSIADATTGLSPAAALSLACGVPPTADHQMSAKSQLSTLTQVAESMADGFKTGVDRLLNGVAPAIAKALTEFLAHIQNTCDVVTAFERATAAFYLTNGGLELEPAPVWWSTLTTECWSELLAEEPDQAAGDLSIECTNPIIPATKGMPAIVRDEVILSIARGGSESEAPIDVLLTGGSHGKVPFGIEVDGKTSHTDIPPLAGSRMPMTYKVAADGRKAATLKVIALSTWLPGILISCRFATKLSPPKKPRKTSSAADWETALSLPGSGRYELLIFTAIGTVIDEVTGVSDDATEVAESADSLNAIEVKAGEFQVEIEADGKYQLDITFKRAGQDSFETCRAYITCEEAKEEGCRSEFERLIKLSRRHLDRFDTKAVVQLDRHARASSLQSWMLDIQNVRESYRPLVIADDYAVHWTPPDWSARFGPILSQGRFLHDPRPEALLFQPPRDFVDARAQIAERIRNTDEQTGLLESAPLGVWLSRDLQFQKLVETYLDSYTAWLSSDRDIACWVDTIAVCSIESSGHTLARVPDAIILSPLHPLRLAWHCLAQKVLHDELEGEDSRPCPAASILDPDCVPDVLTMSIQTPGGDGVDKVDFLSVECNSDYWSVLWNGSRLGQITDRSRRAPFDNAFGITVGGISSGFSPAQVARALEDVSDLLAAKPTVSLVVSSAGGATDACNEGLVSWCTTRYGSADQALPLQGVGPRVLEVFDTRPRSSRPDQATIANLSEDTGNLVRWFDKQPVGTKPDLGIIAQLDSAQPESTTVEVRSPLSMGGLIRHRVRRQLHGAFLSESRQGLQMPPSGDVFADKLASCMLAVEASDHGKIGLQFAPNVHAVSEMLEKKNAGFVAVSSSAIDPACFLGGWIKGTYLWDYDLPSYSHRAGDTNGYYLLSQVKDSDRDALRRVLELLPDCRDLTDDQVEEILLEVARRGIPTVRGLSGDDTGATGDLGLFLAVRLLQDQFRTSGSASSLLPVLAGSAENASIAIIIPVDPFRGYLADLARSVGQDRKENSLSRPDLLVIGIRVTADDIRLHLTPIEVKCRQGGVLSPLDAKEALTQAKALSALFSSLQNRSDTSVAWRLAYQHLLLSMIGFGLRVYSQHAAKEGHTARWAAYHERIAAAILGTFPSISIDANGRLLVVDASTDSGPRDHDGDGFMETIAISPGDAGRMISGDAQAFYDAVRKKVGEWGLLPQEIQSSQTMNSLGASDTPDEQVGEPLIPETAGTKSAMPKLPPNLPLSGMPAASYAGANNSTTAGINLSVGRTIDGFEPRNLRLNISDTRLNQLNIGVVGDLGTGKTQLLKSLIFQIVAAKQENRGVKPRLLIFDYKRDYSTPEFVQATGARVVKPSGLPLNLFDTSTLGESSAPWLDRFRFFADVLDKVYSGIGPVQRDKLKGAVRNAYEACNALGRQPTIYNIHSEYRTILGGKSDSPMAIIDDMVDMGIFERDPAKTKSFDEFFDGVVVISLDAMGQDDRSKNMLVAIMLNMFYENMLKTPKRPFVGTDPQLRVIDSYLLVDEADNIMRYEFDVLRKLLLQGREFGAGVILASQYLRHFKAGATDYREPLLTWFIHKVPNVTAAELGVLGFTSDLGELSDRVKTLTNHNCLYKSFDIAGEVIRGLPFYQLVEDQLQTDR